MKILLAPDKFKGSLTARQVCDAMTEGIRLAHPDAEIVALPMADGGEGTAEVLTQATGGQWITVPALDPVDRPIQASYGISSDQQTAFIEMSQASGLRLLHRNELNPLKASTFGTGSSFWMPLAGALRTWCSASVAVLPRRRYRYWQPLWGGSSWMRRANPFLPAVVIWSILPSLFRRFCP